MKAHLFLTLFLTLLPALPASAGRIDLLDDHVAVEIWMELERAGGGTHSHDGQSRGALFHPSTAIGSAGSFGRDLHRAEFYGVPRSSGIPRLQLSYTTARASGYTSPGTLGADLHVRSFQYDADLSDGPYPYHVQDVTNATAGAVVMLDWLFRVSGSPVELTDVNIYYSGSDAAFTLNNLTTGELLLDLGRLDESAGPLELPAGNTYRLQAMISDRNGATEETTLSFRFRNVDGFAPAPDGGTSALLLGAGLLGLASVRRLLICSNGRRS